MKTHLTNTEVVNFLQDYAKNSETIILEEGKEKDELIKIAGARGIHIKGSKDLAIFKTIYAFTDKPNANGAILPKKELLKVLPQLVGKPIDINHNRRFVVGHYIDYRYRTKENQAIAYGIFYKSNFEEEFETAKKLFKQKKLSSSFEIWSPEDKRKELDDGSYELHQLEIAGGALVYEDEDNQPAFKDAKVLSFAKEAENSQLELVYASKYKEDEIIVCNGDKCRIEKSESFNCECVKCGYKMTTDKHCNSLKCPKCQGEMRRAERPGTGRPDLSPNANGKIKCSNCEEEFEYSGIGEVKCPKCFAILNKTGQMIYPPQIMDFKILCPACKVNRWLILSKKGEENKVRCLNCSKEYSLTFTKTEANPLLEKIDFVYIGKVNCYQCGKVIHYSGVSSVKERTFKCKSCGLEFTYNLSESEKYKKIMKIEEIKEEKSSEKGGTNMPKDKKIDETSKEISDDQKRLDADLKMLKEKGIEPVKAFVVKKEDNTVEAKEQPEDKVKEEVQEAPKAEEKVEDIKKETEKVPEKAETQKEGSSKVEIISGNKLIDINLLPDKVEEARFELEEVDNEELEDEEAKELEESARLTYEQKQALPDSSFAVIVKVKDKRTDKMRKIRKYPIHDEAHVRNALARLGQPKAQATLRKLGVSVEAVRRKVLRRARQLKMTQLLERYKSGLRKLANKYKEMKKSMTETIDFYKTNAVEISKRREELKDFGKDLSDVEILNDEKFAQAKANKTNASITKASVVGNKDTKKDDDYYTRKRKEIDDLAFGRKHK